MLLSSLLACTLPVSAQVIPRAILVRTHSLPGVPGTTVSSIDWIAPNHAGGIIASVGGSGGGFVDGLWGSLGGGSLGPLRTAGPVQGGQVQTFDRACAGGAEYLVYGAQMASQPTSLLVNDTIIASVGDATAPGGGTWVRFDDPLVELGGEPWFRGLYAIPGAGSVWGLFRGSNLQPIHLPLDVIPGLPGGLSYVGGGPDAGYDVSETGAHWMGVIRNQVGSREAVIKDGEIESAGGVPLVSWNTLPPAFQQFPNEAWNHFDQAQVLDNDRYALIAYTPRGILLRDGGIFVRNGDVVDGLELTGDFRGIALNKHGGLAWSGGIRPTGGGSIPAVFREHDLLFKEGDTVDIDGDGALDPGNTVFHIPSTEGHLVHTEDGTVWAIVQLDTPNIGQPWALLAVGDVFGVPYCSSQPNSTGLGARIQATGSPVLMDDSLRLRCVDLPHNAFGYFLCSRMQGFVAGAGGSQGDLCLSGAVGRFNGMIVNSGGTGSVEIPVSLGAMPQPTGAVSALAGESWNFQCWFRDTNPTVTSNLSDGIEVVLQ